MSRITFPGLQVNVYKDVLYVAGDAHRLSYLSLLAQNLWEGFCLMGAGTSGHVVTEYVGTYSPI